jgi:predicted glycoside hydrolase/deacetylase ChbG (UPF0249 family)
MKNPIWSVALLSGLLSAVHPVDSFGQPSGPQLLLRVDDIGMNHSVNMALKEVAATGMRVSASVMFACPWYQEAVEILKQNPQITVGVHLTLNSEWKHYRWGPLLGKEAVPSLVDKDGLFHPSVQAFLESGFKLEEVERELEAQIQRALATGLTITYVDFHMRTALATPELAEVTVKLARKYNLRRSMFMNEHYKSMFDVEPEKKKQDYLEHLKSLKPTGVNLVIIHMAVPHPEMKALIDMNNAAMRSDAADPIVANHRAAELGAITSREALDLIKRLNIKLVNYGDL